MCSHRNTESTNSAKYSVGHRRLSRQRESDTTKRAVALVHMCQTAEAGATRRVDGRRVTLLL